MIELWVQLSHSPWICGHLAKPRASCFRFCPVAARVVLGVGAFPLAEDAVRSAHYVVGVMSSLALGADNFASRSIVTCNANSNEGAAVDSEPLHRNKVRPPWITFMFLGCLRSGYLQISWKHYFTFLFKCSELLIEQKQSRLLRCLLLTLVISLRKASVVQRELFIQFNSYRIQWKRGIVFESLRRESVGT